jgi:Entner-Doudoroff aldolase
MTNEFFESAFATAPIMAILRGMGVDRSLRLATTAWELGIDWVEVPLQVPEDETTLRELVALGKERGVAVCAGTIIDPAQIPVAQRAGAAFIVSPGLDPRVVECAAEHGIPVLPGVSTPSEVQLALSLGLTWLKAFPAHWLGLEWFRHVRGPFPQARFVATGGLDATNAGAFLDAGVRVVAVGSALDDERQLEHLAELARRRPVFDTLRIPEKGKG